MADEVGCGRGHMGRQLKAIHRRNRGQPRPQGFDVFDFRRNQAVHGPLTADMLHQGTGINIRDGHDTFAFKIILNAFVGRFSAERDIEISTYKSGYLDVSAFRFFVFDAIIANVYVGGHQDLAELGGIGENFLITGHTGVEADFADSRARFTGCFAVEDGAIF